MSFGTKDTGARRSARGVLLLTAAIGVCTTASPPRIVADEPASEQTQTEPDKSDELREQLTALEDLRAAYAMADFGRRNKSPETLLAAARVCATATVSPLEAEVTVEGGDAPADRSAPEEDDPQAALEEQARAMIKEAREFAGNTSEKRQNAVNELADSILAMLDESSRGVVGGPRGLKGLLGPGQTASFTFDLYGGFTTVNIFSLQGADMDVRVVGALTGLEYARDDSPAPNASANFQHLPAARVVVLVTNACPFPGQFVLQTN